MRKIRLTALLILLLPAAAVAGVAVPTVHERSEPALNAAATAEVGQPVLTVESFLALAALRVNKEIVSKGMLTGRIVLLPGIYSLEHTDAKGAYYSSSAPVAIRALGLTDASYSGGIFVPTDPAQGPSAYQDALLGRSMAQIEPASFEALPPDALPVTGFRRQLIYAGVQSGAVHLTYREFQNDLARPAFTQELSYDLAAGEEIGFRGARIKIVKASNTQLDYVVLRGLDGGAKPQP